MRNRILTTLLWIGVAAPAIAKDDDERRTSSGKRIVEAEETVEADSSEHNRENKKFSIVAESGFGVGAIPTSGIIGGYYLAPDMIVEAGYVSGEIDLLFMKINASLFEARLKKFFGNSFYTNLGLAQRTVGFEATLKPLTGSDEVSTSVSVQSIGLDFGIGNRWQWEYFTIGCDWIGYFSPISSSDAKVEINGADASEIKDLENSVDNIGKSGSGQLLRFYLGASF